MPRLLFEHPVTDAELWGSKHADRVALFAAWGSNVTSYVAADGSNSVVVAVDVHDMEGMEAHLASPEIVAAKQEHGVIDQIAVFAPADG